MFFELNALSALISFFSSTLWIDYLTIFMSITYNINLIINLHSYRVLSILIPTLIHFATEPTPDLLVQSVTIMVYSLPSFILLILVLIVCFTQLGS